MAAALSAAVLGAAAVQGAATTKLDLPARYMWGWGPGLSGYCGSMSTQTAGLYHGNWISQDQVRKQAGGEVLIGENAVRAMRALHLSASTWDYNKASTPQNKAFIQWAAEGIAAGNPIVIGVYMREAHGDADYDHIVPMVGFDGAASAPTAIYWNDLHANATRRTALPDFVASRKQCVQGDYYDCCIPKQVDYGIRVTGNVDPDGELLPARVSVSTNWEPDYSKEDKRHMTPVPMAPKVVVSGLTAGARYSLLRFDGVGAVPKRGFLGSRAFAQQYNFTASAATWALDEDPNPFLSSSAVFYRAVALP